MASDVELEEIIVAVRSLNETLDSLVKYGRDAVRPSMEDFVDNKIGKLFGLATGYKACLQRLGLTSKTELERKISRYSRHPEVRELGSELLDFEHDWDTFLHSIDKTLEGEGRESVQLGQTGPIDVEIVDARTSHKTSLRNFLNGKDKIDDIEAASGQIIIVSFGLRDGAKLWLEDTKVPFPMILDSSRRIYHAFGLHRSVQKVWGVASMVYYGEAMLTGKPLPKPYENVHDDTQQMGGDFILDKDGIVKFLYPSQTNTDRPSADKIIEELEINRCDIRKEMSTSTFETICGESCGMYYEEKGLVYQCRCKEIIQIVSRK